MDNSLIYPRYAVFGNGHDAWTVDLLFGNARYRGRRAVQNITIYTAQKEISIYQAHQEKMDEPVGDTSIARGYGMAHDMAMKELRKLNNA